MAETVFPKPLDQEVASINAHLANVTKVFDGSFTTSNADYALSQSAENFLFIAIATNWYGAEQADNCVIIPSFLWATNEYLDIHRHNDNSTPYLRINSRSNNGTGFNAKISEAGIRARIYGIISK